MIIDNIVSVQEVRDINQFKVITDENGNQILQEPPLSGYKLTIKQNNQDITLFVPVDPNNSHYQLIQQWIKEGNEVIPAFIEDEVLEKWKEIKINQLKQSFNDYKENRAHVLSQTINKEVDARLKDLINIDALLSILPTDDSQTIQFRCYDNTFVEVNYTQLSQIKQEIIQYGLTMYQKKWQLEETIQNMTDLKELITFKIDDSLWTD